jgi:hypothetical protein
MPITKTFQQVRGGIMIRRVIFMFAVISLGGPLAWAQHTAAGTWRFAVSGDSRNCGDVVMPAIAQNVLEHDVRFYWHLGDFRLMSGVDEDMQTLFGKSLGMDEYKLIAWGDFLSNQVAPFGLLPVYLGIGNHELKRFTDRSKSQAEREAQSRAGFLAQFGYWLNRPEIFRGRPSDMREEAAKTYYNWKDQQLEFIFLDNASPDGFEYAQLKWLEEVLARDKAESGIKVLVVGMHRALPNSLGCAHSMNGDPAAPSAPNRQTREENNRLSTESGRRAYEDLAKWQKETGRPVYVLASHSHSYMANVFQTEYWNNRQEALEGWIVGTAGARRNALPSDLPPTVVAKQFIYGYLLATVQPGGKITFEFKEITEKDIPPHVLARYGRAFVNQCFVENRDPTPHAAVESCNDK